MKHADFYVTVASGIPVFYLVVAFQFGVFRALQTHFAKQTTGTIEELLGVPVLGWILRSELRVMGLFVPTAVTTGLVTYSSPFLVGAVPLSSVGAAVAALMLNADTLWLRLWSVAGLALMLAATAALAVLTFKNEQAPLPADAAVPTPQP